MVTSEQLHNVGGAHRQSVGSADVASPRPPTFGLSVVRRNGQRSRCHDPILEMAWSDLTVFMDVFWLQQVQVAAAGRLMDASDTYRSNRLRVLRRSPTYVSHKTPYCDQQDCLER